MVNNSVDIGGKKNKNISVNSFNIYQFHETWKFHPMTETFSYRVETHIEITTLPIIEPENVKSNIQNDWGKLLLMVYMCLTLN